MSAPLSDIDELLRSMQPSRNAGVYVFASVPADTDTGLLEPVAMIRERQGLTVVVEEERARQARLRVLFRATWITLDVHSDLAAVGLTAAFSKALGDAGISCNVIAGAFHDHLFVPVESGGAAMAVLIALQRRS